MPCARHSHCLFRFGRIIFHELCDYALMNALEESSLLEDVSLFDGLVTLMNFYIYAHILNVTLDNFLLILRMMICLTLEFIGRLPMPLVSLISLKLNWFRSQTCLHVLVSLLAILFKIIFIVMATSRRPAFWFSY